LLCGNWWWKRMRGKELDFQEGRAGSPSRPLYYGRDAILGGQLGDLPLPS